MVDLPPPPAPPIGGQPSSPPPERPLVRAPFLAVAALLLWTGAAPLAFRTLSPYPPRTAAAVLALAAIPFLVAAFAVGGRPPSRGRTAGLTIVLLSASVVPFAMVTWAPGVAQPAEHQIPGAPTVALLAAPDGTWDLYLLRQGDANDLVALTDTQDVTEGNPVPSLDGESVLYTVPQASGSGWELRQMRLSADDAPTGTEVLLDGLGYIAPLGWAPDGRLVLRWDENQGAARIVLFDMTTGEATPFVFGARDLAFSPDGGRIAYSAPGGADPSSRDIWVARADGTHARPAIDSLGDDVGAYWSPDGTMIAFTSGVSGDADVFTASPDGSDVRDVTAGSADQDYSFGWGPQGQLLFLSDRSQTGGTFLYFMNADGTDVRLALRI